ECDKDRLFQAYVSWSVANNAHAGSKQQFARDLYAAFPDLGQVQKNLDGDRARFFRGIGLKEPGGERTPAAEWLLGYLTRMRCNAGKTYLDALDAGHTRRQIDEAAALLGVERILIEGAETFPQIVIRRPLPSGLTLFRELMSEE